ncbi:MAG: permease [Desulfovibrio sp.]|jgi:cell division transport system permease protein|nr:permease [Desulfovibrio sp.]
MKRTVLRLIGRGIADLALDPAGTAGALCAVTLTSFLAGLFLMLLTTLDIRLSAARSESIFQIYWREGMNMEVVRRQWQEYVHLPGFRSVRTYTPEQALEELGRRIGRAGGDLDKAFPFLAVNSPLPATALVALSPTGPDPERWFEETLTYFRSQHGVARVTAAPLQDELARAWKRAGDYMLWPAAVLLLLVPALSVGNTVRLAVRAKEHEIEILQLVGACNWYIRLPLAAGSAALGLAGGLCSLALLFLLQDRLGDALNFPPLSLRLYFPPARMVAALLLAQTVTAALAGILAVRK